MKLSELKKITKSELLKENTDELFALLQSDKIDPDVKSMFYKAYKSGDLSKDKIRDIIKQTVNETSSLVARKKILKKLGKEKIIGILKNYIEQETSESPDSAQTYYNKWLVGKLANIKGKSVPDIISQSLQESEHDCNCGGDCCSTSPSISLSLNENFKGKLLISEGLTYHIKKKQPLTDHLFRAGSEKYFNLWKEARMLYSRGILEITDQNDLSLIKETDLGEFGMYKNEKVPLDFIFEDNSQMSGMLLITNYNKNSVKKYIESLITKYPNIKISITNNEKWKPEDASLKGTHTLSYPGNTSDVVDLNKDLKVLSNPKLNEAEYQGKDVELNKPKRGGSKAYYVYVKDGDKVKKVLFGSGELKAKINNPEARKAFASRHDCKNKKDKTTAGYWSCNLPKYAKQLGLKSNFSGYW